MPQTMLALLALAVAMLLSLSQQRVTMDSHKVRLRDEYSVAASGMLMQVMELVAARSFDEVSTPGSIEQRDENPLIPNPLPSVSSFTAPSGFGLSNNDTACNLMEPWRGDESCDDVDDYDGIEWAEVAIPLANGHALEFEVSVSVDYVDGATAENLQVVSYATPNKRVTLEARTPHLPGTPALVRLERVVSYDPVKAEADHDAIYGPIGT